MAVPSDPPRVGRHDDEHLRRFLRARAAGDGAEMRKWWGELVIDFYDRMDGLVAAQHRGRLDADEHELAVSMALSRFASRLMHTFKGSSMGELVNACLTLARGICVDVQRSSVARRAHEGPSFDAGWNVGDVPDTAAWEVDEALRRLDAEERSRAVRDFLTWALPRVGETYRGVLELTFQGAEVPEICDELGIDRGNAYQRRSRGLKDLTKLKEQYDT